MYLADYGSPIEGFIIWIRILTWELSIQGQLPLESNYQIWEEFE